MSEEEVQKLMASFLSEGYDPVNIILTSVLMGFTNSLWRVSGEGSLGITRAFGEDLWNLTKVGSAMLGEAKDTSTPEKAMEFYVEYLGGYFNIADEMDFTLSDDTLKVNVKGCKLHYFTDYLEAKEVPRSVGCPMALSLIAMMEDVTGEPFIMDSLDSKDGNSEIVIKSL
jgi:hypothetical protein